MARILYNLALLLLLPYVGLHLLLRSRRQPEYLRHVGERFGFYPSLQPSPPRGEGAIWLHAVSVGETRACAPLVAALQARYPGRPILLTQYYEGGRTAFLGIDSTWTWRATAISLSGSVM